MSAGLIDDPFAAPAGTDDASAPKRPRRKRKSKRKSKPPAEPTPAAASPPPATSNGDAAAPPASSSAAEESELASSPPGSPAAAPSSPAPAAAEDAAVSPAASPSLAAVEQAVGQAVGQAVDAVSAPLQVRVIGTRVAEDEERQTYTAYLIEYAAPTPDRQPQVIVRRFREFFAFHEQLSQRFVCLPPLPSRTLLRSISAGFVQQRRVQLEHYLNNLAQRIDVGKSPLLAEFLEMPSDAAAAAGFEEVQLGGPPPGFVATRAALRTSLGVNDAIALEGGNVLVTAEGNVGVVDKVGNFFSTLLSKLGSDGKDGDGPLGFVVVYTRAQHDEAGGDQAPEFLRFSKRLSLAFKSQVVRLHWDQRREWLYVALHDGSFHVYNFSDDYGYAISILALPLHDREITAIHQPPGSDVVATVSKGGAVRFFNAEAQAVTFTTQFPGVDMGPLFYDAASERVFIGGSARVLVLNAGAPAPDDQPRARRVRFQLAGHAGDVRCLDYHPPSRMLASGSSDYSIRLWHVGPRQEENTTKCIGVLAGHSAAVRSLCFSHDGAFLASGDDDGFVVLWSIARKCALMAFPVHKGAVASLRLLPSGMLLSCSPDNEAKLISVGLLHTPSDANALVTHNLDDDSL